MIWVWLTLGYLLIGGYLGYRFRLRQGDDNLDYDETVLLAAITGLHILGWPIVGPFSWALDQDEIPIPFTPKWFAVRKITKHNMLEKGRKVLAGEVDPFEEEEKANIGSWGSYPYNILTFPQQTSTTPYTYIWGQTNNTKTNP